MLKKILKWIPAFIILCISWYLSCQSKIENMPNFRFSDKVCHCICFAGFSFFVSFACNLFTKKRIWIPVLIVGVYGLIDEYHQHFTPGRSVSLFDWYADLAGAIIGAVCFIWFYKHVFQKLKNR